MARSENSTYHQVAARPSRNDHPHRHAHPRASEHSPYHRRHRGEETAVGCTVDDHKRHERTEGVGDWPYDEHAGGAEE